jgi:hypothetical protein
VSELRCGAEVLRHFISFSAQVRDELAQWLLPMALRDDRAMALASGLLDEMRARKIVLPALSTVEGLVVDTLSVAEAMTSRPYAALCRKHNRSDSIP